MIIYTIFSSLQQTTEYYNALPISNSQFIPQLVASEEDIINTNRRMNKMQQDVLHKEIEECKRKISEAPKYTGDVLLNCYVMRLKICIASYRYRLAGLIVEGEEYEEHIERLRTGMLALQYRMKRLPSRPTAEHGYLSTGLAIAAQKPKRGPVPLPRRKPSSLRQTLPCHIITQPGGFEKPNSQQDVLFHARGKPTPKPRLRRETVQCTLPHISSSSPSRPKTSVPYHKYQHL